MNRDVARILDANLNRAREALRVIEDYARFVRDDAAVLAATKAARHTLRPATALTADHTLLDARDVESDVGRDLKLESELQRDTPESILAAAFARLGEALRVIGEYGKLPAAAAFLGEGFAAAAERIRYDFYALAPRLLLRAEATARLRSCGVYIIITESLCVRDWRETVQALLTAGVKCLQLREKSLPDAELLARLQWLRDITARHDALLVANDRPDLALLARADALHVGQDDLPVDKARRIIGNSPLIGVSTHTREQARAAAAALPDYLAVGPIFASSTKPQPHIAGLDTLRAVRQDSALPLVAIGGIHRENAARVFESGADVICVCSAVISVADPAAAAASLLKAAEQKTTRR